MKRLALLLCVLFLLMPVDARPEGIGSLGDNGCVCHGGIDENVIIEITGFPEIYVPSQVYNISISAYGSSKSTSQSFLGNTLLAPNSSNRVSQSIPDWQKNS